MRYLLLLPGILLSSTVILCDPKLFIPVAIALAGVAALMFAAVEGRRR